MSKRVVPGLVGWIAVVVLSLSYAKHDYARWVRSGPDAFLAYQQHRFTGTISHPHWFDLMFGALFVSGIILLLYEAVALVTRKLLSH